MKRWLKWVIGIVLFPIVLMLLAILLVYLPPIQKFAKNKASEIAAETLGMDVSIGKVALRFPLSLVIKNAYVSDSVDTVMYVKKLSVHIPFAPLLRQQIEVNGIELQDARIKSKELIPFYYVEGNIDNLSLISRGVDLKDSRITVNSLQLKDTKVDLCITDTTANDTTSSEPFNWTIDIKKVNIENVAFNLSMPLDTMSMTSSLRQAVIEDCVADLGKQSYSLRHFLIDDAMFGMNTGGTQTPGVFNPNDIKADGINLELDSLAYSGNVVRGIIKNLTLSEKSGLAITSGNGQITSDNENIYINHLGLKTTASSLDINGTAGWSLLDSIPNGKIGIALAMNVGTDDIERFMGKLHNHIPRQSINIDMGIDGTLDNLKLSKLRIAWPNVIDLKLDGRIESVLDSVKRAASLNLSMKTGDLNFIKPVLGMPDSSFFIPETMTLETKADYRDDKCEAGLTIKEIGLAMEGNYSIKDERYAIDINVDSLIASDFINIEDMSPIYISMRAAGKGFDPLDKKTRMRLRTEISKLKYGTYDISNTVIRASLRNSNGQVDIKTNNDWLNMASIMRARLSNHHSSLSMALDVDKLDITSMMATDSCSSCALNANIHLSTDMAKMIDLKGGIDNIILVLNGYEAKPKDINFAAHTDTGTSEASINAGDLSLQLKGDNDAMQLANMLQTFMEKSTEQLTNHQLDYSKLKYYLPDLYLELRANNDNPMSNFMKAMGVNIDQTRIRVSTNPQRGLAGDLAFRKIGVDSIKLDSAYMWFVQDSTSIRYKLNIANSQTMAEFVTGISLKGEVTNRSADILLDMFDKQGEKGVYLGCKAEFIKEGLKMSLFPQNPVFLFRDFHLNDSNYVLLAKDNNIYADVTMKDDKGMGLTLFNKTTKKGYNQLTASLSGIDIADIRTLVPMLPEMSGIISADISYTPLKRTYSLSCDVGVKDFTYEKQKVADFSLKAGYVPFGETKQIMSAKLGINGKDALAIGGKYESEKDTIAYRMKLTELPLNIANPFLPKDFLTIDGSLNGEMKLGGTLIRPLLDGNITFNDASVYVVQAGTKFRFDNRALVVDNSCIKFDKFALLTRTDNPFTINGNVDFSDLSAINTDLQFMASNYELLNSKKNKKSLVYGKVYLDAAIDVKGKLDDLKIRGYTKLLGNTNVTYIMKESSLTVQDRLGETITFTNFSDTTKVNELEIKPIPISGMDMLLNVSIDPTAAVNIDLSENGDNRVEVVGGGDLSMQYTAQGDLSLSGRYTFSGGKITYSLPLVKIADFSVKNGGYIDWTGNAFNPTMNLTAIKKVRTDVANSNGEGTRKVDFELSVNIFNSLEDLGLSFDIAAPQDADVQNTLAATGEDERRTMALTMMITGMYTGGGSGDMNLNMGSALNSLLQSEISSAAGKIKAVDLSLGMENPNGEEGLENMDISYKISKRFLNDRFNIVIGGTISTGSNAAESNKESFIDNISIEYRLDNSGTRYIKVFHNKNYESVLEGEITETGAGIVLRKKMLKLGELFIFKRNKSTRNNAETEEK